MLIPNGELAVVDIRNFSIEWQNKSAILRSGWIIEDDSGIPKLTTCYPL